MASSIFLSSLIFNGDILISQHELNCFVITLDPKTSKELFVALIDSHYLGFLSRQGLFGYFNSFWVASEAGWETNID